MGSEFPKSKVRWKQTLYKLYVYCILCTVHIYISIFIYDIFISTHSLRSLSGCQVDGKGCRFILSLISIGRHFKGLVHIYIYTYVYTYVNTYYVMCISISTANTLAEITPARQVNGVSIIKIAVVQWHQVVHRCNYCHLYGACQYIIYVSSMLVNEPNIMFVLIP